MLSLDYFSKAIDEGAPSPTVSLLSGKISSLPAMSERGKLLQMHLDYYLRQFAA